jgi:hypothetical protein
VLLDARTGQVLERWTVHRGVVFTAAMTPEGATLASGGWDRMLHVTNVGSPAPVVQRKLGWSVRQLVFSNDGRLLAVAAWTPQNPLGDQRSNPAVVVYELGR